MSSDLRPALGLLTAARDDSLLVRVHREEDVDLLEVTLRAQWESRPTERAVEAVTRVDIAGGHEKALHLVAGPAPR